MHWGRLKSDLLSRSQMLSEALSVGYFLKFIQTAPSGARSYLHPPHNPPFSRMLQPLWQKVLFFKTLGFGPFGQNARCVQIAKIIRRPQENQEFTTVVGSPAPGGFPFASAGCEVACWRAFQRHSARRGHAHDV